MTIYVRLCTATLLFACPTFCRASIIEPLTNDLWDRTQGGFVTAHSGVLSGEDPNALIGENSSSGLNPKLVHMRDGMLEGFVHYIEWQTPADVDVRSFSLLAIHDGATRDARYRGFKTFRLKGFDADSGTFQTLFELTDIPLHYGDLVAPPGVIVDQRPNERNYLRMRANIDTFTGNRFRAEFVQYSSIARFHAAGPRLWELDGYSDQFSTVPEPSSLSVFAGLAGLVWFRQRVRRRSPAASK